MIEPGFYPPTNRQKLRAWYRRQQAPSLASAARNVDVVRPALTATGAGIVAWIALGAACLVAIAAGFGGGWIALTVVSIAAFAWSFYVN
tara:strand:- start:695 stop:961 length:267 start_codon:yes stop_codon:yes gene_type:complete